MILEFGNDLGHAGWFEKVALGRTNFVDIEVVPGKVLSLED